MRGFNKISFSITVIFLTSFLLSCSVDEVSKSQKFLEHFRSQIWRAPRSKVYGDFKKEDFTYSGFVKTSFVETGAQDGFVRDLSDADKNNLKKESFTTLKDHFDSEVTAIFEDTKQTFFATFLGSIYYLQANEKKFSLNKIGGINGEVYSLAYDPSTDLLAIAGYSSIQIIELKNKKLVGNLTRVSGRITSMSWDPKGDFLAFGLADGTVGLWDWNYGPKSGEDNLEALDYYPNLGSPVEKLLFHPNGGLFFAGLRNGSITALRLKRTEEELGLYDENALSDKGQKGAATSILIKMAGAVINMKIVGERLTALSSTGELDSWNLRGFDKIEELKIESESASDFLHLKNDDFLIVGRSKKVTLLCKNKTKIQSLPLELTPVKIGSFGSSDQLWIVQKTGILTLLNYNSLNCNKNN